jgi:hypothetical protein
LPGPFALAIALLRETTVGDTNTARDLRVEPSALAVSDIIAVPSSLMVLFRIFAYSKSTEVILEIPLVCTLDTGMVFPKASFAARLMGVQRSQCYIIITSH